MPRIRRRGRRFVPSFLGCLPIARILLEFVLPKDGFLILPIDAPEFQDFGPAASALYSLFCDKLSGDILDASVEPCNSRQFEDYTGVDSLSSFALFVIVFLTVQTLEYRLKRPLFTFSGTTGYDKNVQICAQTSFAEGEIAVNSGGTHGRV
jgi:hypothetical protein